MPDREPIKSRPSVKRSPRRADALLLARSTSRKIKDGQRVPDFVPSGEEADAETRNAELKGHYLVLGTAVAEFTEQFVAEQGATNGLLVRDAYGEYPYPGGVALGLPLTEAVRELAALENDLVRILRPLWLEVLERPGYAETVRKAAELQDSFTSFRRGRPKAHEVTEGAWWTRTGVQFSDGVETDASYVLGQIVGGFGTRNHRQFQLLLTAATAIEKQTPRMSAEQATSVLRSTEPLLLGLATMQLDRMEHFAQALWLNRATESGEVTHPSFSLGQLHMDPAHFRLDTDNWTLGYAMDPDDLIVIAEGEAVRFVDAKVNASRRNADGTPGEATEAMGCPFLMAITPGEEALIAQMFDRSLAHLEPVIRTRYPERPIGREGPLL